MYCTLLYAALDVDWLEFYFLNPVMVLYYFIKATTKNIWGKKLPESFFQHTKTVAHQMMMEMILK